MRLHVCKSLYKERKPYFSWSQSFVILANSHSFNLSIFLLQKPNRRQNACYHFHPHCCCHSGRCSDRQHSQLYVLTENNHTNAKTYPETRCHVLYLSSSARQLQLEPRMHLRRRFLHQHHLMLRFNRLRHFWPTSCSRLRQADLRSRWRDQPREFCLND